MEVFQQAGAVPFTIGETKTKDELEESTIWQGLKENEISQFSAAIKRVKFSPIAPFSTIVLSGTTGPWIDARTRRQKYAYAKAKAPFSAVAFRKDGILISLGREDGIVDVYPTNDHQNLIRRNKLNSGVIFDLCFSPFGNDIVAACENGTIQIIDVAQIREPICIKAHEDSVTSVLPLESGNIWVSGSNDRTICLWNFNTKECISKIEVHDGVSHLVKRGNRVFASVAQSVVVIDIQSKASLVTTFDAHTRPIVDMAIVRSNLVTASADRSIKVFDPSSFALLYTMKLHSDIVAFDALPDCSAIAVAMSGGVLQMKYAKKEEIIEKKAESLSFPANFRVFKRQTPEKENKYRYTPWNRSLRKFEFRDALDEVIVSRDAPQIVGVIDELDKLGRLEIAISGREAEGLMPLLDFIIANVTNPIWSHVVIKAVVAIEKIYRQVFADDPKVGKKFETLAKILEDELETQKRACKLIGKIDILLHNTE